MKHNEEITRLVKEMNIPEVTDMFYRYIQEAENLKGDFTKAEDFISKVEHILELIFKKDNWYWNNEIKIYKIILEKYKKIWLKGEESILKDAITELEGNPRRMTYCELDEWLEQGKGVIRIANTVRNTISYDCEDRNHEVSEYYKICGYDEDTWHEPLIVE